MEQGASGLKSRDSLKAIFRPASIAVVGASANPEKWGFKILKNILDAGFQGPVYPINPKAGEILGLRSYRSVNEIEAQVDLAVVIIPAPAVPEAIEECGQKGIKGAIVITGGFSEAGPEGAELERRLAEIAARWGLRVVGPNCQGVNHPHHSLCASWPLIQDKGEMAIISQSGTIGAAFMDWASLDRLGFSAFVSLGNRADIDEADLIEYFSADGDTRVIALYLEGVKDGARFLEAARGCPKPIVVLKPGRTEQGRRAAESHTRSLAGRDEIYEAVFRQRRIHRASNLEELYDFSKALAYLPCPRGKKILIVTSSGGSGVLATDVAALEGLEVASLPGELAGRLRAELPSHFVISNPFDLTGDADARLYQKVVEAASPYYDAIVLIFGDPLPGASEVVTQEPPQVVIYLGGADVERRERELFHLKKIPVFPTPERGIRALSQLVKY